MENIIINNLSIGYVGKKKKELEIINNINATLKSGELTCLIGENGVGKSTLLRTISSFLPKLGGEILLKDKDISLYNNTELSKLIGVVLTTKPDILNMTTEEIVGMGRMPYTGFWGNLSIEDKEIVAKGMDMVGISHLSNRLISTLSDGERQKAMIAKALVQQTPIICLDEPTAYLDYPSKIETMLLLKKLCKEMNKIIFLSTHDLEISLQIADTIWIMHNGEIKVGSPKELANNNILGDFLSRKGLFFNKETLKISIK